MSDGRFILETLVGSELLPFSSSRRVIFIYHDISNSNEPHHSEYYSTSINRFKEHIAYIQSRFSVISLDEMVLNDTLSTDKQYASITFDDGFLSVLTVAFPLLKSKSIPFSIFLNRMAIEKNQLWLSNLILAKHDSTYLKNFFLAQDFDKSKLDTYYQNPIAWVMTHFEQVNPDKLVSNEWNYPKVYMNNEDVRFLEKQGVLIGNHTTNHTLLSKVKKDYLIDEITNNKLYLESLINKRISFFAIPFGKRTDYSEEVLKICKESGHTHILTSNPDLVGRNNNGLIPRIGLINDPIRKIKFYLNRPYLKKIDL